MPRTVRIYFGRRCPSEYDFIDDLLFHRRARIHHGHADSVIVIKHNKDVLSGTVSDRRKCAIALPAASEMPVPMYSVGPVRPAQPAKGFTWRLNSRCPAAVRRKTVIAECGADANDWFGAADGDWLNAGPTPANTRQHLKSMVNCWPSHEPRQ